MGEHPKLSKSQAVSFGSSRALEREDLAFFKPHSEKGPFFKDLFGKNRKKNVSIHAQSELASTLQSSDDGFNDRVVNMKEYARLQSRQLGRALGRVQQEKQVHLMRKEHPLASTMHRSKEEQKGLLAMKSISPVASQVGEGAEVSSFDSDEQDALRCVLAKMFPPKKNTADVFARDGGQQHMRADFFGVEAKRRFHGVYREVLRHRAIGAFSQHGGVHLPNFADDDDDEDPANWLNLKTSSPRHHFARALTEASAGLLAEPAFVRDPTRMGRPIAEDCIDLSHRAIGDGLALALATVMPTMPKLRVLRLRQNRLTDRAIAAVLRAVCSEESRLQELDLSQNCIDSQAVGSIAVFLKAKNCQITRLSLETADLDNQEVVSLTEALRENTTLTELSLAHNLLGGFGEKIVGRHRLSGGAALADALLQNTTLTSLDLSWNCLGMNSGVAIGRALAYNRGLRTLCVAYNSIGDQGCMAIGRALDRNGRLKHLDISYCCAGNRAGQCIAEGLRDNYALETLDVAGNPLGVFGGRALLGALNVSRRPRHCVFDHCSFEAKDTAPYAFDSDHPSGVYSLDMNSPFDWMRARALLWLATTRQGCFFKELVELTQDDEARDVAHTVQDVERARKATLVQIEKGEFISAFDRPLLNPLNQKQPAAAAAAAAAAPEKGKKGKKEKGKKKKKKEEKEEERSVSGSTPFFFVTPPGMSRRTIELRPRVLQADPVAAEEQARLGASKCRLDRVDAETLRFDIREALAARSLKGIREVFRQFDHDHSGAFDLDELDGLLLDGLGLSVKPVILIALMANFEDPASGGRLVSPDELHDFVENGMSAFPGHQKEKEKEVVQVIVDEGRKKKLPTWASKTIQSKLRQARKKRVEKQQAELNKRSEIAAFSELGKLRATSGTQAASRLEPRFGLVARVALETGAQQRSRIAARRLLDGDAPYDFPGPLSGARIECTFEDRPSQPSELAMVNATGLVALAELLVRELESRVYILKMAASELRMLACQVQDLMDRVNSSGRPLDVNETTDALITLLPRIVDHSSVQNLLERNLSAEQAARLREKCGRTFGIYAGVLSGSHRLELASPTDRAALYKLIQLDAIQREEQRRAFSDEEGHEDDESIDSGVYKISGKEGGVTADQAKELAGVLRSGGTSQFGDFSGFRNLRFNDRPLRFELLEKLVLEGRRNTFRRSVVSFDYVCTLRQSLKRPRTSKERVDMLLHECGMHFSLDQIRARPRLRRILPSVAFSESLKLRVLNRQQGPAKPTRREDNNIVSPGLRGPFDPNRQVDKVAPNTDESTCSIIEELEPLEQEEETVPAEKVVGWLKARRNESSDTWSEPQLEAFSSDLLSASCALICEPEEEEEKKIVVEVKSPEEPPKRPPLSMRRPSVVAPKLVVRRVLHEVRVRVCHPLRLGVLTWRKLPPLVTKRHLLVTSRTMSKRKLLMSVDSVMGGITTSTMDETRAALLLQCAFRMRESRATVDIARGAPPRVETFIDIACTVERSGRPQVNPARQAILSVISILAARGISVQDSDVRVTLRTKTSEEWSCTAAQSIKVLPGLKTQSTMYYFDAYVRGIPDDFGPLKGNVEPSWTPSEDAESPPCELERDCRQAMLKLRLATTNDCLTCAQALRIARGFQSHFMKDSHLAQNLSDLAVHLFSRVVDSRNFYWTVIDNLFPDPNVRNALIDRLGWLNVIDVRNPHISRMAFDLSFPDHWKAVNMLTQLAAVEPGLNFYLPSFRREPQLEPIPGWDLPSAWDMYRYKGPLLKGIPKIGILVLDYIADHQDKALRLWLARNTTLAGVPLRKLGALEAAVMLKDTRQQQHHLPSSTT